MKLGWMGDEYHDKRDVAIAKTDQLTHPPFHLPLVPSSKSHQRRRWGAKD